MCFSFASIPGDFLFLGFWFHVKFWNLGVAVALLPGMLESNEEGVIWNEKHGFLTFVSLNEEVDIYIL
ncbi:unnamed protein product [Lactuca virosa]|uniref:Uncharacterized protein n=1 Tax=Lactuca virosa TaxID=75947 RepID=A0AAU9PR53_9ASTR|nr:unnamed protein product [Lactuca virosa]